jgi:hypothetical protein
MSHWKVGIEEKWFYVAFWLNENKALFRFYVSTWDGFELMFGFGTLPRNLMLTWRRYSKGIWLGLQ